MVNINTANEWFENLSFREMESITNIYRLDYIFAYDDEVLADEMFIDIYKRSYGFYVETEGALDVASAPLFDIWG